MGIEDMSLKYDLNHKIYPKPNFGPLLVYKSYNTAMKDLISHSFPEKYRLYQCEYQPSAKTTISYYDSRFCNALITQELNEFDSDVDFADWVILTSKIAVEIIQQKYPYYREEVE